MAVGERRPAEAGVVRDDAADREPAPPGLGLAKGLGVTLRHLFKRSVTQQYPHERPDLPARTRGVIALVQENCTVCYKCARACPDWCIYIDAHKETHDPASGGKGRSVKVLDRFAIDYALCMYCGICVEVCPFDALFWSPEFEYAEFDMVELVHEKERLEEWAATVLPPPLPEEGAELPSAPPPPKAAPTVAAPPVAAVPAPAATRTPTTAGTAAPRVEVEPDQATYERVLAEELAKGSPQRMAESRAKSAAVRAARRAAGPAPEAPAEAPGAAAPAPPPVTAAPAAPAPSSAATPPAPAVPARAPRVEVEPDRATYERVLAEELAKGSPQRMAESRAKSAAVRAARRRAQEGGS